jgi:prepilin-type N-terminal cleavage/methylation domain-containing protein
MTNRHRGFSLIELLIALAILAAVTTIALRATSGLQGQAKYQATVRSLNEIQAAIVGSPNPRAANGSALVSGFVADTGRLPWFSVSSVDPLYPSGVADPLIELTSNPNAIPLYAYYSSNIDSSVIIGVGWQGPYINLSAGPTFIRDGWGNSLLCYNASGVQITQASTFGPGLGTPIAQIQSATASGQAPVSIPNPTITNPGTFVSNATIAGVVTMNIGVDVAPATSGPPANSTFTGTPITGLPAVSALPVSIWVDYIGPDLTQTPNPVADVPVLVGTGSAGPSWVNYYNGSISAGSAYSGQFVMTAANITIGPRVLKVFVLPATVNTASGSGPTAFNFYVQHARTAPATYPIYATSTTNVTLVGGAQTVSLVLPHYSP